MIVEETVGYAGIIDWFKENVLGVKPQAKGKHPKKHDTTKNLLLFGGIALVALLLLSRGEAAKKAVQSA